LQTGKRPAEVEVVAEQLQQARAARDLSAANLKRQQKLFSEGFISGAALDDMRTAAKRDQARVAELEASVTTTRMPARTDEIRAAEADPRRHAGSLRKPNGDSRSAHAAPAWGLVSRHLLQRR
jgi:HlyD family secretion protein